MFDVLVSAALLATFANQSTPSPPAPAPTAGTYVGLLAVPSANGSGCVMGANSQVISEVSFAGLKGRTLYVRVPYSASSNGTLVELVSVETLTFTSGIGTLSPSGTFDWVGTGSASWNVSGSFTASITEVGTHAFMLNLAETYSNCTQTQAVSLARTGVDND
jgi:hypothetical protein